MANFGWDYPPGVTGNEFEIAGPSWEGEVTRTCTQTDVSLLVFTEETRRTLALAVMKDAVTSPAVEKMCVEVILPECPFIDGEVYAWASDGTLTWECPVCGHAYNEDKDDE